MKSEAVSFGKGYEPFADRKSCTVDGAGCAPIDSISRQPFRMHKEPLDNLAEPSHTRGKLCELQRKRSGVRHPRMPQPALGRLHLGLPVYACRPSQLWTDENQKEALIALGLAGPPSPSWPRQAHGCPAGVLLASAHGFDSTWVLSFTTHRDTKGPKPCGTGIAFSTMF